MNQRFFFWSSFTRLAYPFRRTKILTKVQRRREYGCAQSSQILIFLGFLWCDYIRARSVVKKVTGDVLSRQPPPPADALGA